MSDHVPNIEYSMQLSAPEDDPSSYGWGLLQEAVLEEPWLKMDDFNWSAWDQGPEALPENR